jgi:hypothetical protein
MFSKAKRLKWKKWMKGKGWIPPQLVNN